MLSPYSSVGGLVHTHRWSLLSLSLLASSGCIAVNAAGPLAPPAGATLEVGGNYRSRAINRWYCPSLGSFVLAPDGTDFVLHLENRDWLFRAAGSGGRVSVEYPWFRTVSYNGAVGGVSGAILTAVAASQSTSGTVRLDAQTTKGGTLTVTVVSMDSNYKPLATQEEKCEPTP